MKKNRKRIFDFIFWTIVLLVVTAYGLFHLKHNLFSIKMELSFYAVIITIILIMVETILPNSIIEKLQNKIKEWENTEDNK